MESISHWRTSLLKEKVEPFLRTVRVGIDFGEGADGIAIAKDNNILHREVCLDFHETTLEQRRDLRRGRRTRHGKKMRLARLRSWILRQKVPDGCGYHRTPKGWELGGDRLPDPYELMRKPQFQCQPGEYAVGKKKLKETVTPTKFDLLTWVEAVRRGKRTDAASFVIALTHIFQKRGFGYSDADLEAMKDEQLRDFVATACLKNSPESFLRKLETQIKRRELVTESEDQGWRGKTKVSVDELRDLFNQAKERTPQPRKATHRREKVQLLRKVIAEFGKANNFSDDKSATWQNELAGPEGQEDFDPRKRPKGLLNKVVRAPRFENRIRSGCTWCGKTCARKNKFRRQAYLAAVNNLRVWEIPPSSRPLAAWQKDRLRSIWKEGEHNAAESKAKFLGQCRLFSVRRDRQEELARLFDAWSANGAVFETGLKGLRCRAGGQKPRKLKDVERVAFEVLWTGDLREEITQDGTFWKKFHEKISKNFNALRAAGHPIANEALKKQLTDLLTVQPKGRHRLCPTCLEKAARGETMFDQGIDPWTIKLRSAPNPCREQHQQRILRRLEYLLFQRDLVDPHKVKYITLEIPKPQPTINLQKGEQTKTERRSPKALLHEEAFGKCIYCDKALQVIQVTEDHIFPQSWGGPNIRESNLVCACEDCNKAKDNAVPFFAQHIIKPSWDAFVERVRPNPRLSSRKKDILLLGSHGSDIESLESFKALGIPLDQLTDEQREEFSLLASWQKGNPFPDNPTALARAGAMPRPFLQGIRKMFKNHDLVPPEVTPIGDAPVVQRAEGWMTSRLRNSWRCDMRGEENFPAKATDGSLEHHAQDAALLAALPPHQWREQIFIEYEKRNGHDLHGLALKALAPNWKECEGNGKPLIHILETSELTWQRAWRKGFLKKTFWKFLPKETGSKKRTKKDISPQDSFSKPASRKGWLSANQISERKGEFLKGETWQHKPRWENLQSCPHCGKPLKDDKSNGQIIGKRCKTCKKLFSQADIPGQRRKLTKSQQQGQLLVIHPKDGPPRIVNTESVAEAICLVRNGEKYYVKFRLQPAIVGILQSEYEPPLVKGDEVLPDAQLRRNQIIRLPARREQLELTTNENGTELPLCYPAAAWRFIELQWDSDKVIAATFIFRDGYYRVKELSLTSKSAEVWYESLAKGVAADRWCCPLLNMEHLKIQDLTKDEKEKFRGRNILKFDDNSGKDPAYGVKEKFPERKLGITELRKLATSQPDPERS